MSNTDHIEEEEVLRRMLNTPQEKHKPLRNSRAKSVRKEGRADG